MFSEILRVCVFGATMLATATTLFNGHENIMSQALINDQPTLAPPEPAPIPADPTPAQEISINTETPIESSVAKLKEPTLFRLPAGVHFDCVLLKYDQAGERNLTQHDVLQKLDGGRVIAYPDSYVPIIIRKDKVEAIKKLLNDGTVMPLSEGLAWPRE